MLQLVIVVEWFALVNYHINEPRDEDEAKRSLATTHTQIRRTARKAQEHQQHKGAADE
jgi:hypothetical protein